MTLFSQYFPFFVVFSFFFHHFTWNLGPTDRWAFFSVSGGETNKASDRQTQRERQRQTETDRESGEKEKEKAKEKEEKEEE